LYPGGIGSDQIEIRWGESDGRGDRCRRNDKASLDLPLGEIVLVVGQVSFLKIDIHDSIVVEFDPIVVVPVCGGQAIGAILADDLVDYDVTSG